MSPSDKPTEIRIYFKNNKLKVKPRWAELEIGVDNEVEWVPDNDISSFDVQFAPSPFSSPHFDKSKSKSGKPNVTPNEGEEKLFKYDIKATHNSGIEDNLDPGIIIWK